MPIQRGLGRGLASIIPQKQPLQDASNVLAQPPRVLSQGAVELSSQIPSQPSLDNTKRDGAKNVAVSSPVKEAILFVDPTTISANPYQPRDQFEQDKLKQLAQSILEHGIMNPLIVTKKNEGGYELIAGERRLRAAKDIGLKQVPIIVRDAGNLDKLVLSLIENIQREDLNPLELGEAYKRFLDEFSLTQEALAKKLGKSRSYITNTLRLLDLPDQIKESLLKGEISEGHAKVIAGMEGDDNKIAIWRKIIEKHLTVHGGEHEARRIKVKTHSRRIKHRDVNVIAVEEQLENKLGTKVTIKGTLDKGHIVIDYFGKDELRRVTGILTL